MGIIFYILSRKISKISSSHEFSNLINKNHSSLPQQISVLYDGIPVKNVSSSEFIIWNSGNTVITKSALATKEPLRIEFNQGVRLLRYQVIVSNNKINNFHLKIDENYPNSVLVDFDFLEKNEGARIEILHSGDKNDLKEKGKLIGVKSIFSKQKKQSKKQSKKYSNITSKISDIIFYFTAALFPLMILAAIIYSFISPEYFTDTTQPVKPREVSPWPIRVMGLFALYFWFSQIMRLRPPYPSSLKKSTG